MKVTINKSIREGKYVLRFKVHGFTPEEEELLKKFSSPLVQIPRIGGYRLFDLEKFEFPYPTADEANASLEGVLRAIRQAVETVRSKKDEFSETIEVEI